MVPNLHGPHGLLILVLSFEQSPSSCKILLASMATLCILENRQTSSAVLELKQLKGKSLRLFGFHKLIILQSHFWAFCKSK